MHHFKVYLCASLDRRCLGRTCGLQYEDVPELTWSIVAAGDQRDERNGKSEKKTESPHGWEEGKNEGIMFPPLQGNFVFQ